MEKITKFLDKHDNFATQAGVVIIVAIFLWLLFSGNYQSRDDYRGGYGPGYTEF